MGHRLLVYYEVRYVGMSTTSKEHYDSIKKQTKKVIDNSQIDFH